MTQQSANGFFQAFVQDVFHAAGGFVQQVPRSLEQVGEQSFRQAPSAQDAAGNFLPRRCQAPSAIAPLNEPLPF
jgi:hypothetical protein